jgi:hypothetical protein
LKLEESWKGPEAILLRVKASSEKFHRAYRRGYLSYRHRLMYFDIPIIVFSSVNSVLIAGGKNFLPSDVIEVTTCMLALVTGIIQALRTFLKIDENRENCLVTYKDLFRLFCEISIILAQPVHSRSVDAQKFMLDKISDYKEIMDKAIILEGKERNNPIYDDGLLWEASADDSSMSSAGKGVELMDPEGDVGLPLTSSDSVSHGETTLEETGGDAIVYESSSRHVIPYEIIRLIYSFIIPARGLVLCLAEVELSGQSNGEYASMYKKVDIYHHILYNMEKQRIGLMVDNIPSYARTRFVYLPYHLKRMLFTCFMTYIPGSEDVLKCELSCDKYVTDRINTDPYEMHVGMFLWYKRREQRLSRWRDLKDTTSLSDYDPIGYYAATVFAGVLIDGYETKISGPIYVVFVERLMIVQLAERNWEIMSTVLANRRIYGYKALERLNNVYHGHPGSVSRNRKVSSVLHHLAHNISLCYTRLLSTFEVLSYEEAVLQATEVEVGMLAWMRRVTQRTLRFIRTSEGRRWAQIGPITVSNDHRDYDDLDLLYFKFDDLSNVEGAFISPSDIADHIVQSPDTEPIKWLSRLRSDRCTKVDSVIVDDEPTGAICETLRIGGATCYLNKTDVPFSGTSRCRVLDDSHCFA